MPEPTVTLTNGGSLQTSPAPIRRHPDLSCVSFCNSAGVLFRSPGKVIEPAVASSSFSLPKLKYRS